MYIIDTNSFIKLHGFFPSVFPTLWQKIDILIREQRLISVSEVLREINDKTGALKKWAEENKIIFTKPSAEEALFVREIFEANNGHFQHNIKRQNILTGSPVADPFVVARAKIRSGILITEEVLKPEGSKIPNICEHFQISYSNLQGLMETEKWSF